MGPNDAARSPDEIKPVFPADAGPAEPVAERYCGAVHKLAATRIAACCDGKSLPAIDLIQSQCVNTLSYDLRNGSVKIDPAALDACVAAQEKATQGCDWVDSYTTPITPACSTILVGALAEGATCRSSLECAEGSRCLGLSTLDLGKCGPPKEKGQRCNSAVDVLASFARQDDVDRRHPECAGYCNRFQCADLVGLGEECKSPSSCGKNRCVGGKCVEGTSSPAVGERCPEGMCAAGARCLKGTCAAPKAESDKCSDDAECRGSCVREDGGASGKCEKRCPGPLVLPPSLLPQTPKGKPRP